MEFADFLGAIATMGDGIGEGLVAMALGFAAQPTGIGFLVGAVLVFSLNSVVPMSFEVESATVISRMAERDWKRMAYMILLAGVLGALLGLSGVYGRIVEFIEGPILAGMMTGVGVILAYVALDTLKESRGNRIIGIVSIVSAVLAFFILYNNENNLIYAMIISIVVAAIVARFVPFKAIETSAEREKIKLIPLDRFRWLKDIKIIRGALALLALRVGTSITASGLDGQMAGVEVNVDHSNLISGLSGIASSLFGGAPVEPIISGTAASPHPVISAVIFMVFMAILLLTGILPKLARIVPMAAVAGILFILGVCFAIVDNINYVVTEDDMFSGPVTVVVTTATYDPFLGMCCGVLTRFLAVSFLGMA